MLLYKLSTKEAIRVRVLIVSHNVFSRTSNMGKTLLSYFRDFQPDEIAQFYIHSEIPTDDSI